MSRVEAELWRQAAEVAMTLLDLEPEERQARVEQLCGSDAELRKTVEQILERDESPDTFLQEPALDILKRKGVAPEDRPEAPLRIDKFEILRSIERGGMGEVYLARQDDGEYDRTVALKLIHTHLISGQLTRRFRKERQILANLEHPNIARLYEGGTWKGMPYLTMEYIEGEPIDRWCDSHDAGLVERLELLATVSETVQYLHQNLVIHRDLKPANILVDKDRVPKLLDFGIATLISSNEAEGSHLAATTSLRALTPAFASPEQLTGQRATTISDVFALGVLIYKTLIGRLPFEWTGTEAPAEMADVIRNSKPAPPSQVAEVSDGWSGGSNEKRLLREVDMIVLKALSFDEKDRYGSAQALADDLRRALAGHPVLARPANRFYIFRRFLGRHRRAAIVSVATFGLLLAILVALMIQTRALAHSRDIARMQTDEAESAQRRAEAVTEFLRDSFRDANPVKHGGREISALEVISAARERIPELTDDPEVAGELSNTIGVIYQDIGSYEQAQDAYNRALEHLAKDQALDQERSQVLANIGSVAMMDGRLEEAIEWHRKALDIRRGLGPTAQPLIALSLSDIANSLRMQGEFREASVLLREALAIQVDVLDRDDPNLSETKARLASCARNLEDFDLAAELFEQVLASHRRRQTESADVSVASALTNYAGVLLRIGRYREAENLLREALQMRRELFSQDHPSLAHTLNTLGTLLQENERPKESLDFLIEAEQILDRLFGDGDVRGAIVAHNLAESYMLLDDVERAESYYRKALASLGSRPQAGAVHASLASLLVKQDRCKEAKANAHTALDMLNQTFPDGHLNISFSEAALGTCLIAEQRYAESESYLLKSYHSLLDNKSATPKHRQRAIERLIDLYSAQGRTSEVTEYRRLLAQQRTQQ